MQMAEEVYNDLTLETGEPCHTVAETVDMNDTDLFNYFMNPTDDLSGSESYSSIPSPLSSEDTPEGSPPPLSPYLDFTDDFTAPLMSDDVKPIILPVPNVNVTKPPSPRTSPKKNTKSKAGGKRKMEEEITSTPLNLSKEDLLKLNSKSLENIHQTIASNRQLTPEEERQLKRQRRLIKNRESAQLSRLRKKIYIEELEKKVSQLTAENENLSKQVLTITGEKKKLEEEVFYLQSIIKQSPQLAMLAQNSKKPLSTPAAAPKNVKAAGICLLIVLFSFGLLFNNTPNDFTARAPREEIPEVIPQSTKSTSMAYTGRTLKTIKEEVFDITRGELLAVDTPAPEPKSAPAPVTVPENPIRVDVLPKATSSSIQITEKRSAEVQNSKKRKMKISDELVPMETNNNVSLHSTNSSIVAAKARPNTAYIYCPTAEHLVPTERTPETIALLIPSSVLNATVEGRLDTSLLEVSCSVLNLHMWPLNNSNSQRTASP